MNRQTCLTVLSKHRWWCSRRHVRLNRAHEQRASCTMFTPEPESKNALTTVSLPFAWTLTAIIHITTAWVVKHAPEALPVQHGHFYGSSSFATALTKGLTWVPLFDGVRRCSFSILLSGEFTTLFSSSTKSNRSFKRGELERSLVICATRCLQWSKSLKDKRLHIFTSWKVVNFRKLIDFTQHQTTVP